MCICIRLMRLGVLLYLDVSVFPATFGWFECVHWDIDVNICGC